EAEVIKAVVYGYAIGIGGVGGAVFCIVNDGRQTTKGVAAGVAKALIAEPVSDTVTGAVGPAGKLAEEIIVVRDGETVGTDGSDESAGVVIIKRGGVAGGIDDGIEGAAG